MFSRKQVMQFRHLDLNETLGDAIKMLERLVGEHVQIDFRPEQEIPAIHADPSMIEQIAMNLAVNARDAMPNGGSVTITTTLEKIDRGSNPLDPGGAPRRFCLPDIPGQRDGNGCANFEPDF